MKNQHEMGAVLLDSNYIRLIYKIWIPKMERPPADHSVTSDRSGHGNPHSLFP